MQPVIPRWSLARWPNSVAPFEPGPLMSVTCSVVVLSTLTVVCGVTVGGY